MKEVSKQIHANPKVEICAFKNGEWLRVAGELVEDDRREARQSMLIIDKKRMKMKDAGLPSQVMEQANKLMQRAKLPIVKAKVGPRVMTLIADEQIYDDIPVKKEVKATVSGLYITGVRGLRGPLEKPVKKKKGFRAKLQEKYNEANAQLKESKSGSSRKKK